MLTAARDALQKEPVTDKTALQALFDELSALENDGYTDESWAVLQQALVDAKVVLDNAEATQEEVDAAKVALYEARCALEKEAPQVDKAVLQVLFDQLSVLENNGYTMNPGQLCSRLWPMPRLCLITQKLRRKKSMQMKLL